MRRFLIVDDSGVVRELVAGYLGVFDAEIWRASTGTEGWEFFERLDPDLVVSDIEMPGLSGFELAQRIRQNSSRRVPVVLISSGQGEQGRAAASRGEVDAFLQKPVAANILRDTVARLLGIVPGETESNAARRRIRVVIADDTEVGRQILARLIAADPAFELVGTGCDGVEAVALTVEHRPQMVLLDALMPKLDGLGATKEIMRVAPTRVVIVTAHAGLGGATAALDATKAGALDVLAKPSWHELGASGGTQTLARLRELAEVPVIRRWKHSLTPARPRSTPPAGKVRLVAIAASTGGPAVLARILPALIPVLPQITVLIVQHVLAGFAAALASWLSETTGVKVEVAEDGDRPERGKVYLAPDGHHLAVHSRDRLLVSDTPPIGAHRPSATLLFETAAATFHDEVLAIILTGMGRDGVKGLEAIRRERGVTLAQAPSTCAVPGMPSAAIDAGLADLVLTPEDLAAEVMHRVGDGSGA